MKSYINIKLITIAIILACLVSFDIPKGWIVAGSHPKSYDMGTAVGQGRDGKNCATIQSKDSIIDGFGTLMQLSSPEKYLGKRVRMSAYVKTENVADWSGLWMRCDGKMKGQMLAFDNMNTRSINGTKEWKQYFIVLDVPESTTKIAFGTLLSGTGKVWFDEIQFEIVDLSVETTDKLGSPKNLNFED